MDLNETLGIKTKVRVNERGTSERQAHSPSAHVVNVHLTTMSKARIVTASKGVEYPCLPIFWELSDEIIESILEVRGRIQSLLLRLYERVLDKSRTLFI